MKILHIITGLHKSGAEQNLFFLVTDDKKNKHIVVSLLSKNFYGYKLEKKNIKVYYLNFDKIRNIFDNIKKLLLIIKKEKPLIVQTWMYHADIIGGIISKIAGIKKVVWNIRSSFLNFKKIKFRFRLIFFVHLFFSNFIPNKIIVNSRAAINFHSFLFNKKKFILVNNGFRVPKNDKINLLNKKNFIIGHFARFDPQKNHQMIIELASSLKSESINFKLLLFGRGVNYSNHFIKNMLNKNELNNYVELFGEIKNVDRYYQQCDCVISTSIYGEGFPNVLAEAMNNGVISLSTNIGESLRVVGKKKRIFSDLNDLKIKVLNLKNIKENNRKEWLKLKYSCKKHIRNNFSINQMLKSYNNIWDKL